MRRIEENDKEARRRGKRKAKTSEARQEKAIRDDQASDVHSAEASKEPVGPSLNGYAGTAPLFAKIAVWYKKNIDKDKMSPPLLRECLRSYLERLGEVGNALVRIPSGLGSTIMLARLITLLQLRTDKRVTIVAPKISYLLPLLKCLSEISRRAGLKFDSMGVYGPECFVAKDIMIMPYDYYIQGAFFNKCPTKLLELSKVIREYFAKPTAVIFFKPEHMDGRKYFLQISRLYYHRIMLGISTQATSMGLGIAMQVIEVQKKAPAAQAGALVPPLSGPVPSVDLDIVRNMNHAVMQLNMQESLLKAAKEVKAEELPLEKGVDREKFLSALI